MRLHSVNASDDSDVYSEVEEHVDVESEGTVRPAPILSPADLRVHERLQGDSDSRTQAQINRCSSLQVNSSSAFNLELKRKDALKDSTISSVSSPSAFNIDFNRKDMLKDNCNTCSQNSKHTNKDREGLKPPARPSFLITDILSTSSRDRARDSDSSVASTPLTPCTPTLIDINKTAAFLAQRQTPDMTPPGVSPTGRSEESEDDEGKPSHFFST